MRADNYEIEKIIMKDANDIKIDQDFKANLKKQIMAQGKSDNNVIDINKKTKNHKNHKYNKYLKIASSFAIVVFIGGAVTLKINSNPKSNIAFENENPIKVNEVMKISNLKVSQYATNSSQGEQDSIDLSNDNSVEIELSNDTNSANIESVENTEIVNIQTNSNTDTDSVESNLNSSNINEENQNSSANEDSNLGNDIDNNADDNQEVKNQTVNNNEESQIVEENTVENTDSNENNVDVQENDSIEGTIVLAANEENIQGNEVNTINNEVIENVETAETTESTESTIDESGDSEEVVHDNNVNKQNYNFNELAIDNLLDSEHNTAASPNLENTFDETPLMENVKEDNQELYQCYDSRYSADGTKMAIAKKDGIYLRDVLTQSEERVVAINSENEVVEKPNLTQNGDFIYAKASKIDSGNYEYAVYLYNVDNNSEEKLVDGKNPTITKDGTVLAYEYKDKICIKKLNDDEKSIIIDDGNFPSWSENSKYLSYVKITSEKESFDETTEQKNVFVEKKYSTVWIYDLVNDKSWAITNKEFSVDNSELRHWADNVVSGSENKNFDMYGKYSYYESIWSNNNKELFVIRRDNESKVYELVKYNLDF